MDRVRFFLMIRRPPRSTRTDTLFPYTTRFRSGQLPRACRNAWENSIVPDYAIGTIGDFNIIGAQTGERRYDLLKWRYGRKFTRPRPIRCAFKTVLHHPAIIAEKLYRSEEHTSELKSLLLTSSAVFCLHKKQ